MTTDATESAEPATASAISIVVCTYAASRRPGLDRLLGSLARGSREPFETIVVLDRAPDVSTDLRRAWPTVRVIDSPGAGLSAARNAGWRAARGAWVAFLDDDVEVERDWLDAIIRAIELRRAQVLGGWVVPRWPRQAPSWYSDRLAWVVGCSDPEADADGGPTRGIIGANMVWEAALLRRLGGFDERLGRGPAAFLGSEETELSIRAREAGATLALVREARVAHVVEDGRTLVTYLFARAWSEGRSKAIVAGMHPRALGPERRYAIAVLRESGQLLSRREDRAAGARAAGMLLALIAAAGGYSSQRVGRRARRVALRIGSVMRRLGRRG